MKNKKNKMKFKERFHRIEVLLIVSLLVVLVGIISIRVIDFSEEGVPKFSSFVSAKPIVQDLNLELYQSQMFEFSIEEESFRFTSLSLSGFVEGKEPVQMYLENDKGEKLLIYTNVKEKSRSGDLITGLVSEEGQDRDTKSFILVQDEILSSLNLEITEDQELKYGSFYNECSETCFIDPLFSQNANYKLVFYLGENARLKINKIVYTRN